MLKQSSHALLVFTGVLWPDFGFLDLVSAILQYQKTFTTLQAAKEAGKASIAQLLQQRRQQRELEMQKESSATAPRLREQLISLKLPQNSLAAKLDSPCSVATPGSGSSPSSRSEASNRSTELLFERELVNINGSGGEVEVEDAVPLVSSYNNAVRRRIVS
jgi:Putative undecaprenyl diphosphate synthase